jgi:tetratricopeptide (TPR) repeat protein
MLVQESMTLLHANRNEEAKQKLIKAVALAPDYPDAHHDYGLALAKTGDLREAANQFQLAVKLNPALEQAWMSLGGVYQANGQVKDALDTYQQFLVRFPNSPDAPQVKNLVAGLSQIASSQPPVKPDAQPAAQKSSDYLADVTKSGAARWSVQKMPLNVYMRPATSVPGFQPQFAAILQECLADWSRATGNLITFKFVDSEPDADIVCSWTADHKSFANSAELGEVELTTSGNYIIGATLKLLTVPALPGATMTPNTMRSTCLHEIGHVLGLAGHTTNPGDIMFYDSATIYDHRRELSQQDINTIRKFYSAQ